MKLNVLGRVAMNGVARHIAQEYVASWFERLGGKVENGHVLELGCGSGNGVLLISRRFHAAEIHAIDLDPAMIEIAQRRQ